MAQCLSRPAKERSECESGRDGDDQEMRDAPASRNSSEHFFAKLSALG